jgi:sarcosine oxidase subunit beta
MATSTDILVIGGGVIGSSIAYHLARTGLRVLIVERTSFAVPPSASWASAGGVRRQGRDPAEAALATEAIARWPALADELGMELHYRQIGQLLLAENEEEAARLVPFVQSQQALGFDDIRLVDRAELRSIAPGLAPQVVAGSYSPADGQADPARTTRAFATAAERYGARYRLDTTCTALLVERGRVVGVRTSRGDIAAEHTVLAAGAWSDELAATAGLNLPIRTGVYQMLRSSVARYAHMPPVMGALSRRLSLKLLVDGSYLIGGGWPGSATPDRRGYRLDDTSISGSWAEACAILPTVDGRRIIQAWCGIEAECYDGVPLIGPVPGVEGLTLAVGFTGHGFAIAPAVGRAVADLLDGQMVPALDQLLPERMSQFDPAAVAQWQTEQDGR